MVVDTQCYEIHSGARIIIPTQPDRTTIVIPGIVVNSIGHFLLPSENSTLNKLQIRNDQNNKKGAQIKNDLRTKSVSHCMIMVVPRGIEPLLQE